MKLINPNKDTRYYGYKMFKKQSSAYISITDFIKCTTKEQLNWLREVPELVYYVPNLDLLEIEYNFDIINHCIHNKMFKLCEWAYWENTDHERQLKYINYIVDQDYFYHNVGEFISDHIIHGSINPKLKLLRL